MKSDAPLQAAESKRPSCCPVCGTPYPGQKDELGCPVCMLRRVLEPGAEEEPSSAGGATSRPDDSRFDHYELAPRRGRRFQRTGPRRHGRHLPGHRHRLGSHRGAQSHRRSHRWPLGRAGAVVPIARHRADALLSRALRTKPVVPRLDFSVLPERPDAFQIAERPMEQTRKSMARPAEYFDDIGSDRHPSTSKALACGGHRAKTAALPLCARFPGFGNR